MKNSYIASRIVLSVLFLPVLLHLITVAPLLFKPLVVCDERNPIAASPKLGAILVLMIILGLLTFSFSIGQLYFYIFKKRKLTNISATILYFAFVVITIITLVVEFNHAFQLCF